MTPLKGIPARVALQGESSPSHRSYPEKIGVSAARYRRRSSIVTALGVGTMRVRSTYCSSVRWDEAATNRTSKSRETVSGFPAGFRMRRKRPDRARGGQPSGRAVPLVSTAYSLVPPPSLPGTEMAARRMTRSRSSCSSTRLSS